VAFGIIARGSAFGFRKVVDEVWRQRLFGAGFAASGLVSHAEGGRSWATVVVCRGVIATATLAWPGFENWCR
jgi:hypothetical protein